jgi:hypothetical protein
MVSSGMARCGDIRTNLIKDEEVKQESCAN